MKTIRTHLFLQAKNNNIPNNRQKVDNVVITYDLIYDEQYDDTIGVVILHAHSITVSLAYTFPVSHDYLISSKPKQNNF